MNFFNLITEASQEAVSKLDKIEKYFSKKGTFKEIYPEKAKWIHHIRRENYIYNRKNKKWYAVMIILKDRLYNHQEKEFAETIKDLEIIKDNNGKVERNNLIIKILIPEIQEET